MPQSEGGSRKPLSPTLDQAQRSEEDSEEEQEEEGEAPPPSTSFWAVSKVLTAGRRYVGMKEEPVHKTPPPRAADTATALRRRTYSGNPTSSSQEVRAKTGRGSLSHAGSSRRGLL